MRGILPFLVLIFVLTERSFGAACCAGGSAKTFVSLQRLQNYEVGLSSSFRDVYGIYNPYGDLLEADKIQTLTVSFGAAARLADWMEGFVVLPFVYQLKKSVKIINSRTNLGDVVGGARFLLLESLFRSDWYPNVALVLGMKFPTGVIETVSDGKVIPGTGTGTWEPFLSLELRKEYAPITLAVAVSYTGRLKRMAPGAGAAGEIEVKEGDKVELSETASYAFSRRFNTALGSSQAWEFDRTVSGVTVPYTFSRVASLSVSSTYFFTQFFSLTGGFDVSIPRFGVNQQAPRSVTLTTKYGFY
jgi:hypothetical protein